MTFAGGDGSLVRGGSSPTDLLQLLSNPALLSARVAEAQAAYDKAAKAAEALGDIDAIAGLRVEAQAARDEAVRVEANARYQAERSLVETKERADSLIAAAEARVTETEQTISDLTEQLNVLRQRTQIAQADLTAVQEEVARARQEAESKAASAATLVVRAEQQLADADAIRAEVIALQQSWARKIDAITKIVTEA